MNNGLVSFTSPVSVVSCASVVGKKEYDGPLGKCFDMHCDDDRFGMDTWEKSESESQRMALNLALSKRKLDESDIEILLAGDLINQCTSSAYGLRGFGVPFLGLYGACSTIAEGLSLASMLVSAGYFKRAAAVTSSHNCSAERQFRFPLEYGGQRPPTSQWTVTGSGAVIVSGDPRADLPAMAYITEVMPGIIRDRGVTDQNNMGAAMAPAAYDTLSRYFKASKTAPTDFDMILTGDLGFEGHRITAELLSADGIDTQDRYTDCGLMIYDRVSSDVHSGGSGCGCSATVLAGYLLPKLASGELNNILLIGTGALMSTMSIQQGQSIPGIAHLVRLVSPQYFERSGGKL